MYMCCAKSGCWRRELPRSEKQYIGVFNHTPLLQLDPESFFHSTSGVLLACHRQICGANALEQENYSTSAINGWRFKVVLLSVPLLCWSESLRHSWISATKAFILEIASLFLLWFWLCLLQSPCYHLTWVFLSAKRYCTSSPKKFRDERRQMGRWRIETKGPIRRDSRFIV